VFFADTITMTTVSGDAAWPSVTAIGHRTLPDGSIVMEYFRAGGSKVELGDQSYGYDTPLTPYTDVEGTA
jgi:hypothetical protein